MSSNRTQLPIVLGVSRRNSVLVETVCVMHTRSLPLFRLVSEIELPLILDQTRLCQGKRFLHLEAFPGSVLRLTFLSVFEMLRLVQDPIEKKRASESANAGVLQYWQNPR